MLAKSIVCGTGRRESVFWLASWTFMPLIYVRNNALDVPFTDVYYDNEKKVLPAMTTNRQTTGSAIQTQSFCF